MINRQGQKAGTQRGNRQRFPYEPRVVGGKLLMPAELQAIHRYVVETPVLEAVTEEIRAVWRLSGLNLYRSFHQSHDIAPQATPDRPRLRDRPGRRGRDEPADPFGLRMSSLERAVLLYSVVMFVVSTVAFSVPR